MSEFNVTPKRITAEMAIEAIKDSRGFVTTVAKRLGCQRNQVYRMLRDYPTVRQAMDDEREKLKDFAESKLFKMIDDEVPAAVLFYLKTQARDRGYIEKQQLDIAVKQELDNALSLLEKNLTDDEYQRILFILAGGFGKTEIKALSESIED